MSLHVKVLIYPWIWLGWAIAGLLYVGLLQAEPVSVNATTGLRYDLYSGIPGRKLADLTGNALYPDHPTEGNQHWTDAFYGSAKSSSAPEEQLGYGDRLSGYVIPPKTGDYVFWVGGHDAMELYLSTTADPAAKTKIAWATVSDSKQPTGTKAPEWRSNGSPGSKSAAIHLTAGTLCYIELLHKAAASSSGIVAVGWTKPGENALAPAPTEVIPADCLSPNLVALPRVELTNEQRASRFLGQATFGATPDEVASLAAALKANPQMALNDWIQAQFAKPIVPTDFSLQVFRTDCPPDYPKTGYRQHTHDAEAIRASLMISDTSHELRRKVAYALSQIFVVSDQGNGLIGMPEGMCDWNDLLFKDAFSDFATILHEVTYHPAMAEYLSLAGNAKAGFYNAGSRPDENYAREVMQLFTIGLVDLNPDGSMVTDGNGKPVPTYNQDTITEMARVFTGLEYPTDTVEKKTYKDGVSTLFQAQGKARYGTDIVKAKRHDVGEKKFLGKTLPAGQTTEKDIADALAILFNHPNTAPFFARGMIQRLVTSNPSPAYVQRVAESFVQSKGDMKTVIGAILLDPEAIDPSNALNPRYGKLREPWARLTQVARAFNVKNATDKPYFPVYSRDLLPSLGQFPYAASSVFNFYLPTYQSPGIVTGANAKASDTASLVVDPEFQIMNSNTALLTPNYFLNSLDNTPGRGKARVRPLTLDLTPQIGLASDTTALVDNVDTLLTAGMMSTQTRKVIIDAVNVLTPASDPAVQEARAKTAIYLTLISPDYAIQK